MPAYLKATKGASRILAVLQHLNMKVKPGMSGFHEETKVIILQSRIRMKTLCFQ
jgi:hypothetical protein